MSIYMCVLPCDLWYGYWARTSPKPAALEARSPFPVYVLSRQLRTRRSSARDDAPMTRMRFNCALLFGASSPSARMATSRDRGYERPSSMGGSTLMAPDASGGASRASRYARQPLSMSAVAASRDRVAGKRGSFGNCFSSHRSVPTQGMSDCGTSVFSWNCMPAQEGAGGNAPDGVFLADDDLDVGLFLAAADLEVARLRPALV